jgi:alpha-amylase
VDGRYEFQIKRANRQVHALLQRTGHVEGVRIKINKLVSLDVEGNALAIHYLLEDLPRGRPLHFAVEFNIAGLAAGAQDRYFYFDGQPRAGQLQTLQDCPHVSKVGLVDEWLKLDVSLSLSRPAGVWAFPIQTVSQSEGGFELVYQSTAVLPHWHIQANGNGRWEVTIRLAAAAKGQ